MSKVIFGQGEIVIPLTSPVIDFVSRHSAWFHPPNVGCVFRNGAVTRKFPGARYVQDRFVRPGVAIGIQCAEAVEHAFVPP
jgi:hypothetical protein